MANTIDTSIISPYVNAHDLNSVNSNQIERLASSKPVNKTSENASDLTLDQQLYTDRNVLFQTIANSNNSIAMSQIAQRGLSSQQNILNEIQTLSQKALSNTASQEGSDAIAQQISNSLDEFDRITKNTTYNGDSLLKTQGDSSDDLSNVGEKEIVAMSKVDTSSISDSLRFFLNDFASDTNAMESMATIAQQSSEQLASFANDFQDASNVLEKATKNALESEVANTKSTVLQTDYVKQSSDFNKTNILSLSGYVMQVQPNAQTQKTVSLLS